VPAISAAFAASSVIGSAPEENCAGLTIGAVLQDWEQERRQPEDVARAYLRVIERNPDAVRAALKD